MHVYQPITRSSETGLLIVWFALRPEITSPGRDRPFSEMLSPEICDDIDELERGTKFLSQRMTLSEIDGLKSFISRHTSFSVDELKETPYPLSVPTTDNLWEDLEGFDTISLDDHPGYDLPWAVRGRILEPRQNHHLRTAERLYSR